MSDLTLSTVPADDTARAPAAPTGSRTSSEAERDHSRQESGSRTVRQARGRTTTASAEATSRAGTEPLREAMPIHATRSAPLSGSTPIAQPGSLAAERVAELLAARDAQPAGALGELRLAMDPVRDGLHEVRLALQNGTLDATLRTSDAGFARGLQSEIASLTRSLERQGFDAARVAVQVDAAQQARATALDTVAATEATARERELRGDSDASREGREQHAAHDARRDQQHARQFGSRRPHPF
jgi:flagellar hook-length control protein FliK